ESVRDWRRHAQPCRRRGEGVQGAGRPQDQHPRDHHLRDQILPADRRELYRACRAHAAFAVRVGQVRRRPRRRPDMVMTGLKSVAAGLHDAPAIAAVEVFRLKLPYKKAVSFHSVTETSGQYVILRLALADGTEGIAEAVCRPAMYGEDATAVAYQLDTWFKPLLIGADAFGHLPLLKKLERVRACRTAKALIDVALWDLCGNALGQPVWRLLGGGEPAPVPLTWIAHGNTREAMVAEATRMAQERGYHGMKLKVWKRSMEDIRMVAEVREALPQAMIYVDGNGSYTESEARIILTQ